MAIVKLLKSMFALTVMLSTVGCCCTSGYIFNRSASNYYQRGQYAMARNEFRRAVMDVPSNPTYRHNLAMALMKTGEPAEAERVLRENLAQVDAMHQPSYHSLAQLLVEQNRQAEAQDLLQGWAMAQPYVPESHVELAWLQRETGNLPAAEQSLQQALRANPRHPAALAHLGQLYQDSGQTDRAAAMYQRSLASRWGQPQVQSRMQMLADGSARTGNPSRSAMMMNPMGAQPSMMAAGPPMYQSSPTMISSPMISQPTMMSSAPTTWTPTGQAVIMNPGAPMMSSAPVIAPSPDPAASAISAVPGVPGMAGASFEAPLMAAGPSLTPNADPAHAQPEMTAELPVVDPQ